MINYRSFIILFIFLNRSFLLFSNYPIESSLYNESNILNLVEKFLPQKPNVLEAGAHYGEDTINISSKWTEGNIYAFEPLSNSFIKLVEKTKLLPNVKCYKYALNNKIGKSDFYLCKSGDSASSLLAPKSILDPYLIFDKETVEVDSITIDEWAKQNNITHIDFMWLDMEGAELLALKSAPNIMKTVKVIYTEVNYQEFRQENCFYNEIKEWLESQGFTEIWNHSWKMDERTPWQGNVLFARL